MGKVKTKHHVTSLPHGRDKRKGNLNKYIFSKNDLLKMQISIFEMQKIKQGCETIS